MPTEEPKKTPMPGGLNHTERASRQRLESGGVMGREPEEEWISTQELEGEWSPTQELEGEWSPTQEGAEDTVAGQRLESRLVLVQKPEHDLVPTSTALQVYVPQTPPVVQTQGSVAVVRSRQELLHEAQQTLLKLMVDYTSIVLYLM